MAYPSGPEDNTHSADGADPLSSFQQLFLFSMEDDCNENDKQSHIAGQPDRPDARIDNAGEPASDTAPINELKMPAGDSIAGSHVEAVGSDRRASGIVNLHELQVRSIRAESPLIPEGTPQFVYYIDAPDGYKVAGAQLRDFLRSRGNFVSGSRQDDTVRFRSLRDPEVRAAAWEDIKAVTYHFPQQTMDFMFSAYPQIAFQELSKKRFTTNQVLQRMAGTFEKVKAGTEHAPPEYIVPEYSQAWLRQPEFSRSFESVKGWSQRVLQSYIAKRARARGLIDQGELAGEPPWRNRQKAAYHFSAVISALESRDSLF